MKQERILIKEGYKSQLGISFHYAMEKLREALTCEKLQEVGLTLDSETLIDVLTGGGKTEAKVRKMLKEQLLSGYQLPAIKRSNEELAEKLLKDFMKTVATAKYVMNDFRFIPAEYFYVDGVGRIEVDKQGEAVLKDASNLYIDKPEQIEVYHAAQEVIKAVEKLDALAVKYKCSAFGSHAVLVRIGSHLEVNPDGVVDCHPDGLWMRAR